VDWLCLTEIPYDKVKHIPVSGKTPGFRAIACYDGTEISAESAFELLKAFSSEDRDIQLRSAGQEEATISMDDVVISQ